MHTAARLVLVVLVSTFYCVGQTTDSFIRGLVGQRLILPHLGDQSRTRLKKSHLDRIKGSCDVAVIIERAAWKPGTLNLQFANAGTLSIRGVRTGDCHYAVDEIELELSGFAPDETTDSLAASISKVVQSPEGYLMSKGIDFRIPPGPDDETPVKPPPVIQHPTVLLSVDGKYTYQARSMRRQGEVKVSFVVGTDGRIHKLKILQSLGLGLDENAIRAFSFWRFDPARQADKTVPVEAKVSMFFDII